jgi:DUF4097 and DUF4098 domain-containing protein YvlB
MPTFTTPQPISVNLEIAVGDVRIAAADRADTVVEVTPSNPSRDLDVTAAAQTRVDYSNGALVVKGPKQHGNWRRIGSVDVTIELPAGSEVNASAAMGEFRGEGRLGKCRVTAAAGHIHLDQTGPLKVSTATGDITVRHVTGDAEVATGTGQVRIHTIDGGGVIKNSNGESWIGEVSGDVRLNSANGDITVDSAQSAVNAKTAHGNVRIRDVVRGTIGLETALGELEVGIREGTAAWLDVQSMIGNVRSTLAASDAPEHSQNSVEVRARTGFGDILIHRSESPATTAKR